MRLNEEGYSDLGGHCFSYNYRHCYRGTDIPVSGNLNRSKGNMVIEDISWITVQNNTNSPNEDDTRGTFCIVRIVIKNTGSIPLVITDIYVKQGTLTLMHFHAADTDRDGNLNWSYTGSQEHAAVLIGGDINNASSVLYGYECYKGKLKFNGRDQSPDLCTIPVGGSLVIVIIFYGDTEYYDEVAWKNTVPKTFGVIWNSGYSYTFKFISSSGAIAEETQVAPWGTSPLLFYFQTTLLR